MKASRLTNVTTYSRPANLPPPATANASVKTLRRDLDYIVNQRPQQQGLRRSRAKSSCRRLGTWRLTDHPPAVGPSGGRGWYSAPVIYRGVDSSRQVRDPRPSSTCLGCRQQDSNLRPKA